MENEQNEQNKEIIKNILNIDLSKTEFLPPDQVFIIGQAVEKAHELDILETVCSEIKL